MYSRVVCRRTVEPGTGVVTFELMPARLGVWPRGGRDPVVRALLTMACPPRRWSHRNRNRPPTARICVSRRRICPGLDGHRVRSGHSVQPLAWPRCSGRVGLPCRTSKPSADAAAAPPPIPGSPKPTGCAWPLPSGRSRATRRTTRDPLRRQCGRPTPKVLRAGRASAPTKISRWNTVSHRDTRPEALWRGLCRSRFVEQISSSSAEPRTLPLRKPGQGC